MTEVFSKFFGGPRHGDIQEIPFFLRHCDVVRVFQDEIKNANENWEAPEESAEIKISWYKFSHYTDFIFPDGHKTMKVFVFPGDE